MEFTSPLFRVSMIPLVSLGTAFILNEIPNSSVFGAGRFVILASFARRMVV
jgi:hypothetical protein